MKKEIVSIKRKELKLTKSIKNLGVVNCLLLLNSSKLALTSDYSIIIYTLPLFELTMTLSHHKSAIVFISRLDEKKSYHVQTIDQSSYGLFQGKNSLLNYLKFIFPQ